MKFDKSGKRIGTTAKSQIISSTPFTTGETLLHAEPKPLVEVDAGILPNSWGTSNPKGIALDVLEIAKSCNSFNRYYPKDFPLEESIIDGIGEATTHELTHFVGQVQHHGKSTLTIPDFYNVLANMGHPIKMKMLERSAGFDRTTLDKIKPVTCIDLPDFPEPDFNPPSPPQPFSSFEIGSMTLKVRNN